MKTLIIMRKGTVQQVFVSDEESKLAEKAESLDGMSLFWQRFTSGEVGAHSRVDDEKTYLIYPSETVS